jgi:AraC family transcriptional activator of pobA
MLPVTVMPKKHDGARESSSSGSIPAFFLYGEAPQIPNACVVHVETIAERSRIHDWHIAAHRHHDLHQLLLIERGRVVLRLDAMRATLGGAALIAVPSNTVHAFQFAPDTYGIVVSVARDLVAELEKPPGSLRGLFEGPVAVPLAGFGAVVKEITILSGLLLREFARPAIGRESALHGLLGALLINVTRVSGTENAAGDVRTSRKSELYQRFRQCIEHQYREHIPIETYAAELRSSVVCLRRACLSAVGLPPMEIVHQRLLLEAQRQLRYTTLSVTEIAYQLGFEDPAYFSRFFTRRMKVTPLSFRSRDLPNGTAT